MTELTADPPATSVSIKVEQKLYPRYHDFHGTPDPMTWRLVIIETPQGRARFEQTDYGHPGRWNGWEPRGIDSSLTPKLRLLQALAEAAGALIESESFASR